MREPLWLFQRHFSDGRIPLLIVKAYILFLLAGLNYLHTGCRVVHTGLYPGELAHPDPDKNQLTIQYLDLKLENIMVTFEDPAVLGDFMNSQFEQPMHYKIDPTGRAVYRCHNNFGPLRKIKGIIPKIVDFGLATRLPHVDDWGIYPIQPDHYCAPEVILNCGWRASADIRNLGTLVRDMLSKLEFHSM
jgi:serine/threonine protein kinase